MSEIMNQLSQLFRARSDLFAVIGALTTIYVFVKSFYSLWKGFKEFVLSPAIGLGVDLKTYGTWAVVTGSTDGIGKAYAEALAKIGLNVVLVSRSPEKLNAAAKEIEEKYKVKTRVCAVDFTGGPEIYSNVAQQLAGLDIAILVNNVGMSYNFPVYLTEASDQMCHFLKGHDWDRKQIQKHQDVRNVINVNINAVTFMTKVVLPGMVERKKGVIVNISSLSGVRCVPYLTVYAATKAYVEFFSSGIHEEYKSKGIIVQNVAPGFVATKLAGIRRSSFIVPTPDSFVRSAVKTIGVVSHTFGCIPHALQGFVTALLPDAIYLRFSNNLMLAGRARGLKKRQEKKD